MHFKQAARRTAGEESCDRWKGQPSTVTGPDKVRRVSLAEEERGDVDRQLGGVRCQHGRRGEATKLKSDQRILGGHGGYSKHPRKYRCSAVGIRERTESDANPQESCEKRGLKNQQRPPPPTGYF